MAYDHKDMTVATLTETSTVQDDGNRFKFRSYLEMKKLNLDHLYKSDKICDRYKYLSKIISKEDKLKVTDIYKNESYTDEEKCRAILSALDLKFEINDAESASGVKKYLFEMVGDIDLVIVEEECLLYTRVLEYFIYMLDL